MILLPLVETAFNPELTTPAAAASVAAAEGCLRPIAWATLVSRSVGGWQQSLGTDRLGHLHRQIPTGQNRDFSADYFVRVNARCAAGFSASIGSTALLSRT